MTTPEHTLVGIHVAFALGVHRWWGWPLVAVAAVASNLPDWDGVPMLIDMQRFESGHRVWGHSLLSIFLASVLLAGIESSLGWIKKIGTWIKVYLPSDANHDATDGQGEGSTRFLIHDASWVSLFFIAFLVQLIHLPCDMVVSGGNGLSDWVIRPFWPFSNAGYVYPLIPWGDVGPTVILMAGAIVAAKRAQSVQVISILTLVALMFYLGIRGWIFT